MTTDDIIVDHPKPKGSLKMSWKSPGKLCLITLDAAGTPKLNVLQYNRMSTSNSTQFTHYGKDRAGVDLGFFFMGRPRGGACMVQNGPAEDVQVCGGLIQKKANT